MEIPPHEWHITWLCIGYKAGFLNVYIPTFLSVKYTPPPPVYIILCKSSHRVSSEYQLPHVDSIYDSSSVGYP